jgi:hypothetical protein
MTAKHAKRAVRLYERGLTIDEVVERVGYSFRSIRRMLHANGVAVRERGGGKRVVADKWLEQAIFDGCVI